MKLFDAHCHLQLSQYDADREEVLARMQEAQMGGLVIGVDYDTSRAAVELAQAHNFLWASVGLHPNDNLTEEFSAQGGPALGWDRSAFEALARDPKVVAIGECGLDYFRSGGTDEEKAAQKKRFEAHIRLALTMGKPLIIHCRDSQQRIANIKSAHEDMLDILFSNSAELKNKDVAVVMHFFTGTGELAQKYLSLGCYLSFPGPITYTDMYDESIRVCPLDHMLVETDSPFAAPVPHRGKRNEPAYVAEVARKVAQVKGVSVEEVMAAVVQNARTVFGIA